MSTEPCIHCDNKLKSTLLHVIQDPTLSVIGKDLRGYVEAVMSIESDHKRVNQHRFLIRNLLSEAANEVRTMDVELLRAGYKPPQQEVVGIGTPVRDGDVLRCPNCGGDDFMFEQNCPTRVYADKNYDGKLTFGWGRRVLDGGDGLPGVVCANEKCGMVMDTTEIGVEFNG